MRTFISTTYHGSDTHAHPGKYEAIRLGPGRVKSPNGYHSPVAMPVYRCILKGLIIASGLKLDANEPVTFGGFMNTITGGAIEAAKTGGIIEFRKIDTIPDDCAATTISINFGRDGLYIVENTVNLTGNKDEDPEPMHFDKMSVLMTYMYSLGILKDSKPELALMKSLILWEAKATSCGNLADVINQNEAVPV